jgi:hypothetical protein
MSKDNSDAAAVISNLQQRFYSRFAGETTNQNNNGSNINEQSGVHNIHSHSHILCAESKRFTRTCPALQSTTDSSWAPRPKRSCWPSAGVPRAMIAPAPCVQGRHFILVGGGIAVEVDTAKHAVPW